MVTDRQKEKRGNEKKTKVVGRILLDMKKGQSGYF
jgi:hypothetical protein